MELKSQAGKQIELRDEADNERFNKSLAMDLNNVLSLTPWQARPQFVEDADRPAPLLYIQNGGEVNAKLIRSKR